ncbi:hypothetical protein TRFO_25946 [Tritrichomonas foetus]|uniref:H15 domain-containing protein n=1 Tax=Tritrichomonas foetus TaxID=1144522 RepID=A0A1J4K443_9EUKA|nr:hypothetical protein TRFO_25946 [Tritrichomonas foetus]|eukprot:OHT06151.1 hypothetical protein TRFO_25946 [Tritrichomonas foetus]
MTNPEETTTVEEKTKPKKSPVKKTSTKVTQKKSPKKVVAKATKKTTTKKAAKPAKKTEKKSVKKASVKKEAKKTTTKKVEKKSSESKTSLSSYEKYVIEAIQAQQTEDKKWVGMNSISTYIKTYFSEVKVGSVAKHARAAAEKLQDKGVLKAKKNSFAFAAKGAKYADKKVETKDPVRDLSKKPVEKEEKFNQVVIQRSGRVSVKRFELPKPVSRKK